MIDYYTMQRETRQKVGDYAQENDLPEPRDPIQSLVTALIISRKLSLICDEIDGIVDRIYFIHDRINDAIEDGNLVAVVMLKDRLEEERAKLRAYERLLEKEGPLDRREGEITDEMIRRAKEYPFEDLLPEPLKLGRCKCPVHTGSNQSEFTVKNNYGRCFSCGWHGDTIKYVQDTEGLTFREAVRKLS